MSAPRSARETDFAIKSYRYLRIGMVGVVVLLGTSVALERAEVDCWQTSISAYYYTPVRAIFVGGLVTIGASLIIIKGSGRAEDLFLNLAGMLAPVVAVVPTSDAGRCWSIEPSPPPIGEDGQLAQWVIANIDNNVRALLLVGILGLVVAAVIAVASARSLAAPLRALPPDALIGLLAAFAFLVVGLVLHRWWDGFDSLAHGYAAVLMFAFLALAIGADAWHHPAAGGDLRYRVGYAAIAVAMVVVGAYLLLFQRDFDHMVLVLETIEILLFAAFWLAQTVEHWHEVAGPERPARAGR